MYGPLSTESACWARGYTQNQTNGPEYEVVFVPAARCAPDKHDEGRCSSSIGLVQTSSDKQEIRVVTMATEPV
jgi:hypothetical protein